MSHGSVEWRGRVRTLHAYSAVARLHTNSSIRQLHGRFYLINWDFQKHSIFAAATDSHFEMASI